MCGCHAWIVCTSCKNLLCLVVSHWQLLNDSCIIYILQLFLKMMGNVQFCVVHFFDTVSVAVAVNGPLYVHC